MNDTPSLFDWIRPWRQRMLPLGCALALSVATVGALCAQATDLPPGVLQYLRQKDPHVKLRFDAVVLFSNGEIYVPVIPQDPSLNPDSQQVVAVFPEKAVYPDLIQFDNNFFLMRLIQTASGRLTFPKLTEYPLQLKEGLLPQDLVLPDNLFIPVELKVILGALPYNPSNVIAPAAVPAATSSKSPHTIVGPTQSLLPLGDSHGSSPGSLPSTEAHSAVPPASQQLKSLVRLTYVFDLAEQKLIGIDTLSGRKLADVPLDCVPSSLKLSADGKLLFAPCLSTNELVVVDTGSNLVKTRVPVGQRPDAVLYLENEQQVLVSNRFSPFLSLVNRDELVSGQKIDLVSNGGAMAVVPGGPTPQIVVADAFKDRLYLVDMNSRAVVKTLKALEDISAVQVFRQASGSLRIWAASRAKGQVVLVDVDTDKIVKTLDVGAKPVAMAAYRDQLYVVSAGAGQISVVDRPSQSVVATISLGEDAFPSGIVIIQDEKRAYVVTAAANNLAVINLETNQVETTFPVEFRANMIATVPDKSDPQQREVAGPAEAVAPVSNAGRAKGQPKGQIGSAQSGGKDGKPHKGFFGRDEVPKNAVKKDATSKDATVQPTASQAVSPSVKASPLSALFKPSVARVKSTPQRADAETAQGKSAPLKKAVAPAVVKDASPTAEDKAGQGIIPQQPGSVNGSPLYGQSAGQVRLRLGGRNDKKAKQQPASTDAAAPATVIPPTNVMMLAPDMQK